MNKMKLFISRYWQYMALSVMSGFVVFSIFEKNITLDKLIPQKEVITPECTTNEVKLILENEAVFNTMNLLTIDLNRFDIVETKEVKSSVSKKQMFGVNRRLIPNEKSINKKQYYVTIYEELDDLTYNKNDYYKFLKDLNSTQNK